MSVSTNDPYAATQRIMDALVAAALALDVSLPSRQIISVGGAVYDKEGVYVTLGTMSLGLANAAGQNVMVLPAPCDATWQISAEAAIVRCAHERMTGPRGDRLPTPAMIAQDLADASADAAVLAGALDLLSRDAVGALAFGTPSMAISFLPVEGGLRSTSAVLTTGLWE